eukprot:SM000040S14770  [mRNA]  locus=s40:231936:234720:+ [translate_table: standard]
MLYCARASRREERPPCRRCGGGGGGGGGGDDESLVAAAKRTAAVAAFCRRSASEANVPPLAGGLMAAHLKPAALASLRLILWLLSTTLGTLLLLGRLALTASGGPLGLPWPRPGGGGGGGAIVGLPSLVGSAAEPPPPPPPPPAQAFEGHRELLASGLCDAVVVASPNHTHAAVLLDALAHPAPHHVLVEKPLCTTVEDCARVVAAAAARPDVLVQVGLEYRYMPPVARLLAELRAGAAGRVRMVAIREHRFPFLRKVGNWNRFNRNTGGTLVEKCCHFFDLMTLAAGGALPVRVFASGGQDVNHLDECYDGEVPDILDNAYVIVDYANGVRGSLDLCMFAEGSANEQELAVTDRPLRRRQWRRRGLCRQIEAKVPEGVVLVGSRAGGRPGVRCIACHDDRVRYEGLHHGASYLEHLDFAAAVCNRRRGHSTSLDNDGTKVASTALSAAGLHEGLLSVALGVAAQRSIATGRPVLLADVLPPLPLPTASADIKR